MNKIIIPSLIALTIIISIHTAQATSKYDGTIGMVTIGFDHGFNDQYNASQYMQQYGNMTGTLWVVTNRSNSGNLMPWNSLIFMHTLGWEMDSHTRTHADVYRESYNQLNSEIIGSKQDMTSNGLIPCGFVPPYSLQPANQTVMSMIKSNYNYTLIQYNMTNSPNTNNQLKTKFGIPIIMVQSVGDASSFAKNRGQLQNFTIIKERIDYAVSHKTWLMLSFHDIVNGNQNPDKFSGPTSTTLFQNTIQYIYQNVLNGKLQTTTVSNGLGLAC